MSGEKLVTTQFGFQWGPALVTRLIRVAGRGRVLGVDSPHHRVQVYVSEKGRSLRVWRDGVELVEPRKGEQ